MAINFGRGGLLGYGGGGFSPPGMQKAPPMNGGVMPNVGRPPPNLGSPPPGFSPVPTQPPPGYGYPNPGLTPGDPWPNTFPDPRALTPVPPPSEWARPMPWQPAPSIGSGPAPQQRMRPWGGSNIYNPTFSALRPTR